MVPQDSLRVAHDSLKVSVIFLWHQWLYYDGSLWQSHGSPWLSYGSPWLSSGIGDILMVPINLTHQFWGMDDRGTFHVEIKSNPGYFQTGEQIKGGRFLANVSTGKHRSANKSSSAQRDISIQIVSFFDMWNLSIRGYLLSLFQILLISDLVAHRESRNAPQPIFSRLSANPEIFRPSCTMQIIFRSTRRWNVNLLFSPISMVRRKSNPEEKISGP